ncbi:hypothetical protein Fot_11069 [Forsythia ovata]|uniref:Uncharacterized protein n=1 Tax=Forsythia ovata TaxID=205694 RepID=A0ABD1WIN8_9LAMI
MSINELYITSTSNSIFSINQLYMSSIVELDRDGVFVDRNFVTESKVSSRSTLPKIDAVYDALDDEHKELFLNSCLRNLYNLRVRCTLHASPEEREEEYVRLFVSGPRREDPILDAYLQEDGADGAAGDEELDDIFKKVQEDDPPTHSSCTR